MKYPLEVWKSWDGKTTTAVWSYNGRRKPFSLYDRFACQVNERKQQVYWFDLVNSGYRVDGRKKKK